MLKHTFRALRHRNYRLFFAGQGISLIGTLMQQIALGWLVFELTHKPFFLGLVGFSSQIVAFGVSPFAGVMADRWNKRLMIIATQTLSMAQAFILAILVLTKMITVAEVICLSVFIGLVNGFDIPCRQSFVVSMVDDREDLGNAIALNSSIFNGARLIGPAVAGITIWKVGEGMCFLLNGVSYIAVIIALLAMRVSHDKREVEPANAFAELREGFAYTFGFDPIRSIILLLALVSLTAMPYNVLLPIFADKLHAHAGIKPVAIYGFLSAAAGTGALIGAGRLASRESVVGLVKWIPRSAVLMGLGLVAFSFSHTLWLSLMVLAVVGFGMITGMASCNTILQTIVEDNFRGRVMSIYTMAFIGMAPFGSLLGGSIAGKIGAPHTVMAGGITTMIGGLLFARQLPTIRKVLRPIYRAKGLIPPEGKGS